MACKVDIVDSILYQKLLSITGDSVQALTHYLDAEVAGNVNELANSTNEELAAHVGLISYNAPVEETEEEEKLRLSPILDAKKNEIQDLKKQMGAIYEKFKSAPNVEAKKRFGRQHAKLGQELAELEQSMERLSEALMVDEIINSAEEDINRIQDKITSGNVRPADIERMNGVLRTWLKISMLNQRNPIFSMDDITVMSGDSINRLNTLHIQINNIETQIRGVSEQLISDFVEDQTGREMTTNEFLQATKDVNPIAAGVWDISTENNPLAQSVFMAIKKTSIKVQKELQKLSKRVDELVPDVLKEAKAMGLDNPFEMFIQKDEEGRLTGNIVYRYAQKFFDTKRKRLGAAKWVDTKIAWENFRKWSRNNELIFNVELLFPLSDQINQDMVDAHKQEIIDQVGQEEFDRMMLEQDELIQRYEATKEVIRENLFDTLPEAEAWDAFRLWEKEHSPYWYVRSQLQNKAVMHNGKYVKPKGYQFVKSIPRSTTLAGRSTGFYDENYLRIRENPIMSEFYDLLYNTFRQLHRYLPPHITDNMQINSIPFIKKAILESVMTDPSLLAGLSSGGTQVLEDMVRQIRGEDTSVMSSHTRKDPITNEEDPQLQVEIISDKKDEIDKLTTRKVAAYMVENQAVPTKEEKEQMRKDATHEVNQAKSFDLGKVLKLYGMAAMTYKYRAQVEDQLKMATKLFKDIDNVETNLLNQPKLDAEGNIIPKGKRVHANARMQNALEKFLNIGRTQEGVTSKRILTRDEKKTLREIETLLEAGNLPEEMEVDLRKQADELGGVITGSGILDGLLKYMQLKGMGWNIPAAIANLGFGIIANWVRAGQGLEYGDRSLFRAYNLTLHSMYRNATFNKGKTDIGLKIRAMMDRFDILKDASSELYKGSQYSVITGKVRFLSPFNLTSRTEYLNQAPVMIAIAMETMIAPGVSLWDAFGVDGNIKPEYADIVTEDMLDNFKIVTDKVIRENHGNYDFDASLLGKEKVIYRAMIQFRTWMFEGIRTRFQKRIYSDELGRETKGRYLSYDAAGLTLAGTLIGTAMFPGVGTLIGAGLGITSQAFVKSSGHEMPYIEALGLHTKMLLKKLTFGAIFRRANYDNYTDPIDAANMRANLTEMIIYAGITVFMLMLRAWTGQDEDRKEYYTFLINEFARIKTDITFYISPEAANTLLNKPFPIWGLVDNLVGWIAAAKKAMAGEDEIERGPYAGQSRLTRSTAKLIPGAATVQSAKDMSTQVFKDR